MEGLQLQFLSAFSFESREYFFVWIHTLHTHVRNILVMCMWVCTSMK